MSNLAFHISTQWTGGDVRAAVKNLGIRIQHCFHVSAITVPTMLFCWRALGISLVFKWVWMRAQRFETINTLRNVCFSFSFGKGMGCLFNQFHAWCPKVGVSVAVSHRVCVGSTHTHADPLVHILGRCSWETGQALPVPPHSNVPRSCGNWVHCKLRTYLGDFCN